MYAAPILQYLRKMVNNSIWRSQPRPIPLPKVRLSCPTFRRAVKYQGATLHGSTMAKQSKGCFAGLPDHSAQDPGQKTR